MQGINHIVPVPGCWTALGKALYAACLAEHPQLQLASCYVADAQDGIFHAKVSHRECNERSITTGWLSLLPTPGPIGLKFPSPKAVDSDAAAGCVNIATHLAEQGALR